MRILGKAYKEIYRIIEHSDEEIKNKIPKKFLNVIKSAMSREYEPNIDYNISLNEQDLMPETFAIMAVIYRDFICSKEKRAILLENEKNELEKIEQEKRELYNSDNIFEKRNIQKENVEQEQESSVAMVDYKESFMKRVINKIKSFFHRI